MLTEEIDYLDSQESTLLIPKYSVNTGSSAEHNVEDIEEELAQRYRSQSDIKWLICIAMSFSWMSSYFSVFAPSFLEDLLVEHFSWSGTEYSYMISFTFLSAIFAPIFVPSLLRNFSALTTLIIVQIPIIVGQIIFIIVIISPVHSYYLWILYTSRIIIGFGVGSCDSVIIYVLIFWFGEGNDTSLASCMLVMGVELGIIIGRYSMTPLEDSVGLGYAYILGVGIAAFAILLLVIAIKLERQWLAEPTIPEYVVKHSRMMQKTDEQSSGSTWKLFWNSVKSFEVQVWLVIINYGLATGVMDAMYSTFTSPMIYMYDVSEYTTDKLWGMTSIAVVSTAFFSGYLMDKIGCIVQFNIISMFSFFAGFLLLLSGNQFIIFSSVGIWFNAVLAVSIISIGMILVPAIFSLKAMIVPVKYASFVSPISASFHWITSCLLTDAVGWIEDDYNSYVYCIAIVAVVACAQLSISLILYAVSVWKGFDFHIGRWGVVENIDLSYVDDDNRDEHTLI